MLFIIKTAVHGGLMNMGITVDAERCTLKNKIMSTYKDGNPIKGTGYRMTFVWVVLIIIGIWFIINLF